MLKRSMALVMVTGMMFVGASSVFAGEKAKAVPAKAAAVKAAVVKAAPAKAAVVKAVKAAVVKAAPAKPKMSTKKVLNILVSAVRYGKFRFALKFMSKKPLGKKVMKGYWKTGTAKQKAEFVSLFHVLFAKIVFPRVKKNFKHLKTIVYKTVKQTGTHAKVRSTIVILHALKKQEMNVKYDLVNEGGAWRVVDVRTVSGSMTKNIHEKQIKKIMKKGGWPRLLKLMRKRAAALKHVPMK